MMNEQDKLLHESIHTHMMNQNPDTIFSPRVNVFDIVKKKLGLSFHGRVVDIGCGNGYASIWLAKNFKSDIIYAVEASEAAVNELLPRNIAHHKVEKKVQPLLASFDSLPFESELDYVISFGAIHHSECLYSTMQSISKSLKNGGILITQEPVMPNTTSNQDYIDKYDIPENRFGIEMKNGDRNDRFFREAEYIAAAAFCGLDLILYQDFKPKGFIRNIKSQVRNVLVSVGLLNDNLTYEYQKELMKKIIVFRKKEVGYIPHIWRVLRK